MINELDENQNQNNEQDPTEAGIEVESKLAALSSFLGKEEIDNMKKDLKVPDSEIEHNAQEDEGNENEEDNGNEGSQELTEEQKAEKEKEDAEKAAKEKEAATSKKTEGKNILGLKRPGDKNKTDLVIEKPEQIIEVINSKFGMAIKDVKEVPKFIENVQEWRSKAQKAEDAEKKLNGWLDFMAGAPETILESLRNYEAGKDWEEPYKNRPRFDFNTPVEKQDINTLVNHYYPGKFTEDDFKDENPSELLKMAMDISKDKFVAEKTTRDNERAQVTRKAEEQLKAQSASIQSSVSNLKQTFPDMDPDALKDVQSTFEGGPNKVLEFFYNSDGTVKPEAAKKFMMAKYGEDQIQEMMIVASHVTETKINEDLVSRGADTKKPVKNTGPRDQISDEAKRKLEEFKRMETSSKPTY